jgi:general secretion pathway protein B
VSFILDALRKSESRRKAGEIPDLSPGADDRRASRRRGRIAVLAIVLLPLAAIALAAAIYTVRPQWLPESLVGSDSPDTAPAPEVALVPDVDTNDNAEPEAGQPDALAVVESQDQSEVIPDDSPDESEASREESVPSAPEQRRIRRADPERTVRREAPQRERVVTMDEATEEIERHMRESQAQAEETTPTPADSPPVVADADEAADVAEDATETEPETKLTEVATADPWRPEAAEYVRAWELPLAVRRELPELNLSIHVFSPQSEGRFVLINGERYVPGDSLGGGVQLVDIRREGAVVDFREHRFLLEP